VTQADGFKDRLRESMIRETRDAPSVHFARHTSVYCTGDPAKGVYFIETGLIKLLVLAPDGKECLLAIHAPGDVFGELCLGGADVVRQETATTMEDTTLKAIGCPEFLTHLSHDSLLEGFVHYLAERVTSQQETIAHLVTVDSEHRLGETLLMLARHLGRPDPRSRRIAIRISHEELSQMVGTTRPRITEFMNRLRMLGLVEVTAEHHLIVKEAKLRSYLASIS
jgi:CRP-like cAMP-binding protein